MNEGCGKDFYRKGYSMKRSGPSNEPLDLLLFFRSFFVALIFPVKQYLCLFRGPHFGQSLRVLALAKSSDLCCSHKGVIQHILGSYHCMCSFE